MLCQDYTHFEIIIVDDGSVDNTGENLTDYFGLSQIDLTQRCSFLKHAPIEKIWSGSCNSIQLFLIQKENGGKGDALNAGIDFCHGEYFACVDADCTFPTNTLSCLSNALCKRERVAAVGGRVLPRTGLADLLHQNGCCLGNVLQGCQELEYGIAFCIARPIFDKLGTSILISGALGLFNKDVVIKLGGYALDTVGEDMELVMKIRQFAAERNIVFKIVYTKDAVCFTDLPWNKSDLKKQRIRWTVGLTEVLWKYREMATCKKYNFFEKLTFWYYVLFEKLSPHIEFVSLITVIVLSVILGFSQITLVLPLITFTLRILISIIGSFQNIKKLVRSSENKLGSIIKVLLLLISFVSIYHWWHSFCRLIAVPSYRRANCKNDKQKVSWISPTRM